MQNSGQLSSKKHIAKPIVTVSAEPIEKTRDRFTSTKEHTFLCRYHNEWPSFHKEHRLRVKTCF